MENGMADIPENPSTAGSGTTSAQGRSNERLDPRSGMVSPAAWRLHTDESNLHPPLSSGALGGGADEASAPQGYRTLGRSQTEDFEMRRLRFD